MSQQKNKCLQGHPLTSEGIACRLLTMTSLVGKRCSSNSTKLASKSKISYIILYLDNSMVAPPLESPAFQKPPVGHPACAHFGSNPSPWTLFGVGAVPPGPSLQCFFPVSQSGITEVQQTFPFVGCPGWFAFRSVQSTGTADVEHPKLAKESV